MRSCLAAVCGSRFAMVGAFLMAGAVTTISCSGEMGGSALSGPEGLTPAAASTEMILHERRIVVESIFVPCTGDMLSYSGMFHILLRQTKIGDLVVTKTHFQPQGISGVGLPSGTSYQATGVTQDIYTYRYTEGQFRSFTQVNNFHLIAHGHAPNLLVHELYHITVNPNGEVSAELLKGSVECR